MDNPDTYRTVSRISKGIFRDRGSRFIAFAHQVHSTEEIKAILDEYRKSYHDARHHCYAYRIGLTDPSWRTNDDGEPSGTAGKPILGQISSHNLTNILIVVIRYFGGTLLGTGGLINAYKTAAAEAINDAEISEYTVKEFWQLSFPYSAMNEVMKIIKEENLTHESQSFNLDCSLIISFRLSKRDVIMKRINSIENLKYDYINTR